MKHLKRHPIGAKIFVAASLAMLSGCGGGSSSIDTTPVTKTFGILPSGTTAPDVIYDASKDQITVSSGGVTYATLSRVKSADVGSMQAYYDSVKGWTGFLGASASGDVGAGVLNGPTATTYVDGGQYFRQSAGSVPGSGSASYSGDYAALLTGPTSSTLAGTTVRTIGGKLALTANFDKGTVSGAITDRSFYLVPPPGLKDSGFSLADVKLASGPMDGAGGFYGSASGGEFSSISTPVQSSVTSGGSYEGLFGGADASEVAGGLTIDHTYNGSTLREIGAFIGKQ